MENIIQIIGKLPEFIIALIFIIIFLGSKKIDKILFKIFGIEFTLSKKANQMSEDLLQDKKEKKHSRPYLTKRMIYIALIILIPLSVATIFYLPTRTVYSIKDTKKQMFNSDTKKFSFVIKGIRNNNYTIQLFKKEYDFFYEIPFQNIRDRKIITDYFLFKSIDIFYLPELNDSLYYVRVKIQNQLPIEICQKDIDKNAYYKFIKINKLFN